MVVVTPMVPGAPSSGKQGTLDFKIQLTCILAIK